MSKLQAVPQSYDPQEAARATFSNYVQAVAFQVSLSRAMISMLGYVRDLPPSAGNSDADMAAKKMQYERQHFGTRKVSHFIPHVQALIRRGLVYHDYPALPAGQYHPIKGHRYYRLTRAGELMCELLIEAGLLRPEEQPARHRRAIK